MISYRARAYDFRRACIVKRLETSLKRGYCSEAIFHWHGGCWRDDMSCQALTCSSGGSVIRKRRGLLTRTVCATIGVCLCVMTPPIYAGAFVYVTNSGGTSAAAPSQPGTVSVIDTATNQVFATIAVGRGPVNPTCTRDGRELYVAQTGEGAVAVIDTQTQTVKRQLSVGAPMPSGLAFTPDGKYLVVTLLGGSVQAQGGVRVITLATGEMSPIIPLGNQPERIALTPDGRRAYIVNLGSNSVSVVDLERRAVIATIEVGKLPFNALMSPKGDKVYVGNIRSDSLSVIDTASNQVVRTIETAAGPNAMILGRDKQSLFLTATMAGRVEVISLASGKELRSGDVGDKPGNMVLTSDAKRGYFTRPYGNTVSVLDLSTLSVTGNITVGSNPSVVTLCGTK
jgi:YVTN family beta-propeller protein